jgi:uncharacterized protein
MKKQSERICAVCRESKLKTDLIRLVRDPQGEVSLDPDGKKPGRGAYLCYNPECFKKAKKQRALERSLKGKIPEDLWQAIRECLEERSNHE